MMTDEQQHEYSQNWKKERDRLTSRIAELETRLLSAAGDDLCRLSQEEIKALGEGTVKVLPREEFLASCARFHEQVASEAGVMTNCLTLAQLVAENQQQANKIAELEARLENAEAAALHNFEQCCLEMAMGEAKLVAIVKRLREFSENVGSDDVFQASQAIEREFLQEGEA